MKKKRGFSMLFLSVMLAVSLIFVAIPDMATGAAGGPEPGDVKFQNGKITGIMKVVLGEQSGDEAWVTVSLIGFCKGKIKECYVEVPPTDFLVPLLSMHRPFFAIAGWKILLEMYIEAQGAGPAGCFSEDGGETLMIEDVKKVYTVVNNGGALGDTIVADVVVKALK